MTRTGPDRCRFAAGGAEGCVVTSSDGTGARTWPRKPRRTPTSPGSFRRVVFERSWSSSSPSRKDSAQTGSRPASVSFMVRVRVGARGPPKFHTLAASCHGCLVFQNLLLSGKVGLLGSLRRGTARHRARLERLLQLRAGVRHARTRELVGSDEFGEGIYPFLSIWGSLKIGVLKASNTWRNMVGSHPNPSCLKNDIFFI